VIRRKADSLPQKLSIDVRSRVGTKGPDLLTIAVQNHPFIDAETYERDNNRGGVIRGREGGTFSNNGTGAEHFRISIAFDAVFEEL
jgi:hypothetical protein